MNFTLEISMDNDAFQGNPGHELGKILSRLAQLMPVAGLEYGCIGDRGGLRDSNGNTVGFWEVVE